MKKSAVTLFLSVISSGAFAASTTVHPFKIHLYAIESRFHVKPVLTLSCRYEKMVVSDSAEYYVESRDYNLIVESEKADNNLLYSISLKDKKFLDVTGVWKPTKECVSDLRIDFIDKNYSIGWAGQTKRPVVFSIRSQQRYQAGDTTPDFSDVMNMIDFKNLDFYYKPVTSQVNIWMTADGVKLPLSPISTAIDRETNMPYLLD